MAAKMSGSAHSTQPPRAARRAGLTVGHISGIEIRLDWSVAIIFILVVYSLGAGVFPSWHEGWSVAQIWVTACAAGLLFFTSLLAHELAHAVVAQRRGLSVPSITLFIFGGIAHIEREPDTPATELLIAIVGPAVSLLLGVVFASLGLTLAEPTFVADLLDEPQAAMASLGPVATLLLWLGPVNLMLGVFNLIPGFPLDGGRVFHAVVWWITGDLERATRSAANAGRMFAWILMGLGAFQVLQGGLLQGIWLILIGWFLQNAAAGTQVQMALRRAVSGLKVRDLMRTRFDVVGSRLALESFLADYVLRSGQSVWPVVDDGRLIGMISFDDVQNRPEAERRGASVGDVMRPIGDPLRPQTAGRDALQMLLRSDTDPLPVVDDSRIVGLLHRADIMRWLAVHQLKASGARP